MAGFQIWTISSRSMRAIPMGDDESTARNRSSLVRTRSSLSARATRFL